MLVLCRASQPSHVDFQRRGHIEGSPTSTITSQQRKPPRPPSAGLPVPIEAVFVIQGLYASAFAASSYLSCPQAACCSAAGVRFDTQRPHQGAAISTAQGSSMGWYNRLGMWVWAKGSAVGAHTCEGQRAVPLVRGELCGVRCIHAHCLKLLFITAYLTAQSARLCSESSRLENGSPQRSPQKPKMVGGDQC